MRAGRTAIVANGFGDGPAQALRDFLVERGGEVLTVLHPLTREEGRTHLITTHAGGQRVGERGVRLPLGPPLSFLADPLVPPAPPAVDVWFGFNPLACGRGLLARKQGRAGRVVLWSVDFVPDRFGPGTAPTRIYDRLDRLCCARADARIELSEAAREARNDRHGLGADAAPAHVVPMGAWLDRVPTTQPDGHERRRVVFLGHLVPRQGVDVLLEALALLRDRGDEVTADVIGGGPEEDALRERTRALGLNDVARFHGFVPDHLRVDGLLAAASVAVAPYRRETFTAYADPGKLKRYLGAGLPIVLTDVPPNAAELAREGGAEIIGWGADDLADGLAHSLESPERWRERRAASLAYVRRFDWFLLLDEAFRRLGLEPPDVAPPASP